MRLNSLTLWVTSYEAALIFVTIGPLYLTLAIRDIFFLSFSHVTAYLACVDSAILKDFFLFHFTLAHTCQL